MKKINILVFGNSGAGKSTLINAVLKSDQAKTGVGKSVTKEMKAYESDNPPFRMIDTVGLDFNFWNRFKINSDVKKWTKSSIREGRQNQYIHVIWYCLDATSRRVFDENLKALGKIARIWKNIPIIVVFTKSISEAEIPENEDMFRLAMDEYKDKHLNIRGIVSVLAKPYRVDAGSVILPRGLDALIEKTNDIAPVAFQLNEAAVENLRWKLKRANARTVTALASAASATVGAVPIPMPDALILIPIQHKMALEIGRVYGVTRENDTANQIGEIIVRTGLTTTLAKSVLSALKGIPGLNIAAAVLNAAVAGIMTAMVGEITAEVMEMAAKGKIDPKNLDWIGKFAESEFHKKAGKYIRSFEKSMKEGKKIPDIIKDMVNAVFDQS